MTDLHGRQTGTPGGAGHQQRLSRAQLGPLAEGVIGSAMGTKQRSRFFIFDASG